MNVKQANEIVDTLWRRAVTWGNLERLAGVTNRIAFWEGKDESQARTALRKLIYERVQAGELTLHSVLP